MTSQRPNRKQKTNALFNIIAGILFLGTAFNVMTGEGGIHWGWLLVGIVFVAGGIWGLQNS